MWQIPGINYKENISASCDCQSTKDPAGAPWPYVAVLACPMQSQPTSNPQALPLVPV